MSLDSSIGRPRSDPQKTRDFSIDGVYRKQIEPENDRFCGAVADVCMNDEDACVGTDECAVKCVGL